MVADRSNQDVNEPKRNLPVLAGCLLLLVGLYQFFDRVTLFQDEVINTYKGSINYIFDYSLRPLYYMSNWFFIELLGSDLKALQVSGLFYFVGSGVLTFICASTFSIWAGWIALIVYAFFGQQWLVGIQGMPHLTVALLLLLVVYFWLKWTVTTFPSRKQSFMLGILVALCLITHPTALAFVAAFSIVYLLQIVCSVLGKSQKLWVAANYILGSVSVLALTELVYYWQISNSFISLWLGGLSRVQTEEQFSRYYHPADFYFTVLWHWYSYLLLFTILVFVFFSVNQLIKARNKVLNKIDTTRQAQLLMRLLQLLALSFICIAVISAASWKFHRILISFVPLIAITVALSGELFLTICTRKIKYVLTIATLLGLVFWGTSQFTQQVSALKRRSQTVYYSYMSVVDLLHSLPPGRIGYFGAKSNLLRTQFHGIASRKEIVKLNAQRLSSMDPLEFVSRLENRAINYFILHPSVGADMQVALVDRAKSPYCNLLYTYSGFYQVWHCTLQPFDNPIIRHLALVGNLARVGMIKDRDAALLARTLRRHGLKPTFLPKNSLLNPGPAFLLVDENQAPLFKSQLAGYQMIVTSDLLFPNSRARKFYLYQQIS